MTTREARPGSAEQTVRDIRRATRKQYPAEEKIRIVLEDLRGETSININLRGKRDGIDAASEIVERLGIQSLFVSAMCSPEIKSRAALFSNAGFLTKPVRQRAFISAIDSIRIGA